MAIRRIHEKLRTILNHDLFLWLIEWVKNHCNGDWEHGSGIHIRTLDNPGWSLTIDLGGTELENADFNTHRLDRSEDNWLICFLKNTKFEARCGLTNLPEVLQIFREWVENRQKEE